MAKFSKYIGLDVHKETIAVGIADGRGGLPRYSLLTGLPLHELDFGGVTHGDLLI